MLRSRELPADIKGKIIGMTDCSKNALQISHELGIPHSTVLYTIKRFKRTSSNNSLPRSGRPTLLTEYDKNSLGRAVKENRFKPLQEIVNQLPINVHVHTAQNALKERGVKRYVAARKPNITPKNVQKHKDRCKEMANWTNKE